MQLNCIYYWKVRIILNTLLKSSSKLFTYILYAIDLHFLLLLNNTDSVPIKR